MSVQSRVLQGGLSDGVVGVQVIEVHTGPLSFSVLPTRGMGLWGGKYLEDRLGWDSPVRGPVHPKFVNLAWAGGRGWLTGFDEWVTRCGLESNGVPGEDVHTDRDGQVHRDQLTLHGRIANLPARQVDLDEPHRVGITGEVVESSLFGLCG